MANSNPLAIVSLCLSVLTASFSAYQWSRGEQERKINAAVDISNNYVNNRELASQLVSLAKIGDPNQNISEQQTYDSFHVVYRMQYIAYLIDRGLIDDDYVVQSLKCDMTLASAMVSPLAKRVNSQPLPTVELQKVAARYMPLCISRGG